MGLFQTIIFGLHLAAAITVTAAWYARSGCDVVSRMYVDTWAEPANSTALWVRDGYDPSCYAGDASRACFDAGLPLYEAPGAGLGWHLLALLAHFEWISAGFALYYVETELGGLHLALSCGLPVLGAVLCTPYRDPFLLETVLLWVNSLGSALILYSWEGFAAAMERGPAGDPAERRAGRVLTPVLRFGEYCFSASELIVALAGVFVVDPPAFIPVLAYVGILVCNLLGVVLHLAVVAHADAYLRLGARPAPESRRRVVVPAHWVRGEPPAAPLGASWAERTQELLRKYEYDWADRGSYLNTGLADSWVAYAIALAMVGYQAQLLFSETAPAFVVVSGWMLVLSYTSFGVWVTLVYLVGGGRLLRACCSCGAADETDLLVAGLDALSVGAKLGIVFSLTGGFVFMPGSC